MAIRLVGEQSTGRPVGRVLLHPNLPYAASIDDRAEVTLWRIAEDAALEPLFTVDKGSPDEVLQRHFQVKREASIAFHPHRDLVALAGMFQPVEVWSLGKQALELTLPNTNTSPILCYSADGRLLFAADCVAKPKQNPVLQNPYTAVYDESGKRIGRIGPSDTAYATHPDGQTIAYAINEQCESFILFRKIAQDSVGKIFKRYEALGEVQGLAFSLDGEKLAVAEETPHRLSLMVYSYPRLWILLDYSVPKGPPSDRPTPWPYSSRQMPFRPDSRAVYSLALDGTLLEHKLGASQPRSLVRAHEGYASALDVRHRDGLVMTGGSDGLIRLWRPR